MRMSPRWASHLASLALTLGFLASVGVGCADVDNEPRSTPSNTAVVDHAGAYVFLDKDRSKADEFWDPLLSCVGDPPCDASGSLPGVALMLSARHQHDEGWGIKVVFDPELSSEATATLVQRLTERASAAGVAPWTFLRTTDPWPSCAGDEDCLTVEETLTNS